MFILTTVATTGQLHQCMCHRQTPVTHGGTVRGELGWDTRVELQESCKYMDMTTTIPDTMMVQVSIIHYIIVHLKTCIIPPYNVISKLRAGKYT